MINVYPVPVGSFIPNPQVANILSPIIQFQNYSTNSTVYSWDFGDNNSSSLISPSHTYEDTGNYTVKLMLMSPQGCVDTISGFVRVEDIFSFYVPNAFSPNNDGVNDFFAGYGIAVKSYVMRIYNRWGELIFKTNQPEKPWDGRFKADLVQNDVYVYQFEIIDHHGDKHTYEGNVTVVH
jgi:gliding motility-associated-like protein